MVWFGRNRKWLLLGLGLVVAVVCVGVFAAPSWVWHPLGTQSCAATFKGNAPAIRDCMSYNLHSGILANVQEITLITLIAGLWVKHNCYEQGCPWIGRVKGDDGHLRCKGHHRQTHPDYAQ